ncbi:MAG: hypothetical protein MI923_13720, partial [Phycisphaerales bacterium]|nr:hypothetical protein [Phycisphaerales bacterium]
VEITLTDITTSQRADLDFRRVSTPAPKPSAPPSSEPATGPRTAPITIEDAGNLLFILVIIFAVLVVIYFLIRVQKRGGRRGRGLTFSGKDLGSNRESYNYPYYRK